MHGLHRFAGVILLLSVVACNSSPTAPSGQVGATISGTVSSQIPADLQVSAGAATSVPVGPTGTFTLNVPTGPTDLRFTRAGTTATLPLSALRSNESVTLTVSLGGGTVVVESLRRVYGLAEEVEGQIQSLDPNLMFVAGRSIAIGAGTQFTAGGQPSSATALGIGQRVSVKGQANGASLLASTVVIHAVIPVPPQPTPITFTGHIISKTGSAPELMLIVTSHTVQITATTDVRRNGEVQLASTLATGQTVEVTGFVQPGGPVLATMVNITQDSAGGEFSMEGTIQSQTAGPCPQLQLMVSGYQILTSASTTFATPCSDLAIGDRIEIVGTVQANLSVMATFIREK